MENNICLIQFKDIYTNGFFCKIPFPDKDHMLEVLITNNHVINEDILYKKDEIFPIKINDKKLDLNDRIKYTSKEYDITIIEIKPNKDNLHNFLELDNKILNDIINNEMKEYEYSEYSSIYQIFHSHGFKNFRELVSYGNICGYGYEKTEFFFVCIGHGDDALSGSPILYLNNKVIGITFNSKMPLYVGRLLNFPIKEFIQKNYYKNNRQKEISIKEKENDNSSIIKKYLGKGIFEKLNELYLSFKISFPSAISFFNLEACKLIINQMEKGIYTIKEGNREGVGFPCKIPFPNKDNLLKVFITNNSILNEDILNKKNENILIKLNGEIKPINLSNRRKYSSKEYNTTIIELKDDDGIQEYLDLDDVIINEKNYKINRHHYVGKAIYMIKNEVGILTTTYSIIEEIYLNENQEYDFIFKSNKKEEPLEGPIFTYNCKLIGLRNHFYYEKYSNKNEPPMCVGTFLNYPIIEFIQKFYNGILFLQKKFLFN